MNRLFRWFGLPGRFVLTVLMSLYAILLAVIYRDPPHYIAALAMLLSSLGDIVLMDFKPVTVRLHLRGFITGAIIFMLAQVMYSAVFFYKISYRGYILLNSGVYISAALLIVIYASTVYIALKRHSEGRVILAPCFFYLFVICTTCALVFSYTLSAGGRSLLSAVGILSFIISDCFIIARNVCGIKSKILNELIWWFYPAGQILLLSGV